MARARRPTGNVLAADGLDLGQRALGSTDLVPIGNSGALAVVDDGAGLALERLRVGQDGAITTVWRRPLPAFAMPTTGVQGERWLVSGEEGGEATRSFVVLSGKLADGTGLEHRSWRIADPPAGRIYQTAGNLDDAIGVAWSFAGARYRDSLSCVVWPTPSPPWRPNIQLSAYTSSLQSLGEPAPPLLSSDVGWHLLAAAPGDALLVVSSQPRPAVWRVDEVVPTPARLDRRARQ